MSGRTPIGLMAEGLKQAFEDFLKSYKAPETTRTWHDYLTSPAALLSDVAALVSGGHSEEHNLQEKLLGELKAALDGLPSEEAAFFNYLVAFKLTERLNRSVLEYLGELGSDGKAIPRESVAGLNFVPLHQRYSESVVKIAGAYRTEVEVFLKAIDENISGEDLENIRRAPSATTGPAYFGILLARLERSLWTLEQQRLFGIERSERSESSEVSVSGGGTAVAVVDAAADVFVFDGVAVPALTAASPQAPPRKSSLDSAGTATVMFNAMQVHNTPAAGAAGKIPMAAPDLAEKPGAF